MRREITTGTYWFYRGRFDRGCMNMELLLDCAVDGSALQAAAMRAIRRYPCLKFTCELSEDGRQYLLTENSRAFSVFESPGFVSIEAPASNGYLWSLGYSGKRLFLSVFHGLTDGMGLAAIMKAILCFYYSKLEKSPLPEDVAAEIGAEPDGLEYADPFDHARPCSLTFPFRTPEPFLLEPEDPKAYAPYHRHAVLSLKEVLKVSRQTEGNVSGILSLILARAVDRMTGGSSTCITVKCPINLRPMLGCTGTLQNCVSSVKYLYSEKLRKMPFPQQASCFKGMLLIQSSEEHLMNSFLAWKREVLAFNRGTSIEEKRVLSAPETGLPMVSYLGGLSAGPYDKHIGSVKVTIDTGGAIGVIAASLGDRLYLDLLLSEKKKALMRAFADELDALGVSYAFE